MRALPKPNHSSPPVPLVLDPARVVAPVGAPDVAQLFVEARVQRRRELGAEDVDLGPGEVGQPAGVVGVEVGGDDVLDVAGGEAKRLELLKRGLADSAVDPSSRRAVPSWRGLRASSIPKPVSTRASPPLVSTTRQWQTTEARASRPPSPLINRLPWGQKEPQLRWWTRMRRGRV